MSPEQRLAQAFLDARRDLSRGRNPHTVLHTLQLEAAIILGHRFDFDARVFHALCKGDKK